MSPSENHEPRRALVCQHRFPEHDRERGSLRILELIEALRFDGWTVTFVATDPDPAPRYERELTRAGIPWIRGWGAHFAEVLRAEPVELVLAAFWHVAAQIQQDVRSWCPDALMLVDSVDLHFVRETRRRTVMLGQVESTDRPRRAVELFADGYGSLMADELAAYACADGVLVVSEQERLTLDSIMGRPCAHVVELGEATPPSPFEADARSGVVFVGNFRHLPNAEGFRWFIDEVQPRRDPALTSRHPLRVVGNALDDSIRDLTIGMPNINMVGWVPSVAPELHKARVAIVPLLHGAGVKGKTVQAFAAATPVVSTSVGVEGLDVIAGRHAEVSDDPALFAAHVDRLLVDDDAWLAQRDHGLEIAARHTPQVVRAQLTAAIARFAGIDRSPRTVAPGLAAASSEYAATPEHAVAGNSQPPRPIISVVIATRDRAALLDRCLRSFASQDLPQDQIELVVIDDGSLDSTPEVLDEWSQRSHLVRGRTAGVGRSGAKNLGMELATGDVVLLFDDDDEAAADLCRVHLVEHERRDGIGDAVLGHTGWAPDLQVSPFMHHITDVGQQLFSYPSVPSDQTLGWRHFWEGRISIKRALIELARNSGTGLHDESLNYTIDIEWAIRLAQIVDLRVHYVPDARSYMTRPVQLMDFLGRARAKGRAQWRIAALHPSDEIRRYCNVDRLAEWSELAATIDDDLDWFASEANGDRLDNELAERTERLRRLIDAYSVWGMADADAEAAGRPRVSVIVPVWSVNDELAAMARRTVEQVRAASEPGVEVIVIDDGSPCGPPPDADVVATHAENRGVARSWNHGIRLARGEVVIVLNSDCLVEPGWDRALRHAASDGRRIAFPYTDHGDDEGFRLADQAGTAGWCFAMTRDVFEELGPFDTAFSPAFFEDADYWHRAMLADVELSPVPAARVHHARRTSARHLDGFEEIFTANRRRYEAKHGVGFDRPPPYFARRIVEYPPPAHQRLALLNGASPTEASELDPDDPMRPRVFGIGLSKTATSSLHAALAHLGFRSVHHGEQELRDSIKEAIVQGRPPLSGVDSTLDAFCDIPAIVRYFAEIDRWYPGSRFVLTVRDLDPLVESHRIHVAHNRSLRSAGLPHGTMLDFDEQSVRARAIDHAMEVTRWFADRPEALLVLDICGGDGWELLAPFVGWQRVPERPFPWRNRAETVADVTTEQDNRVAIP